jgi:hypothetical protein
MSWFITRDSWDGGTVKTIVTEKMDACGMKLANFFFQITKAEEKRTISTLALGLDLSRL